MTGSIALFLAATALLLTSLTVWRVGRWRHAQVRVAEAMVDAAARLRAATELIERSLDRIADRTRTDSLLSDLAGAWDLDDALQRVTDVAVRSTGAYAALATVRGADGERRTSSSGEVAAAEANVGAPFESAQAMTFTTLHREDPDGRGTAYGAAVPLTGVTAGAVGTLVALFASNEASVQGLGVLERVAAAAAPMLEGAQGAPGPTDDERAPDPGIEVSGRVAFQIGLAREAARARRQHRPLAVVLVAVDRPDRVLADLADLLEGIRPAASRLYRVGATSFALVLPGHTSEHARGLVGDLQAARRRRPDTAVSEISAAVVELEDEDDVVSLTARAGTALEAARQPHLSPADGGG